LARDINTSLEIAARSNHEVRDSEERYRVVIEQASEGMYLADVDTKRIVEVNNTCRKLLGYDTDEALSLTLYDIIAHDPDSIDNHMRLTKMNGHRRVGERQYRRKDGSLVDVDVSASLITYGDREVLCVVIRDVTERKQTDVALRRRNEELTAAALENARLYTASQNELVKQKRTWADLKKEHAFISAVVDNAGMLIVVIDKTGHIVSFNNACEQTSGYLFKEVKDKFFYDVLLTPEDVKRVKSIVAEVQPGQVSGKNESYWLTKNGDLRLISWSNTSLVDSVGATEFVVSMGIDITEQRLAEAALRKSEQRYRALYAAAERQAREMALLDEVRTVLTREPNPQAVFRTVVETVASTFGYAMVSLYLIAGDKLVLQHQVGYDHVKDQVPLSKGIMGIVARTGKPKLVDRVEGDPSYIDATEGMTSQVCVPIFDQDDVVGVLNVESTTQLKVSGADLSMMMALSEHINIAVERARLYTEVRELAVRDGLTGIYNRREMERLLKEEVARHNRYGGTISLILLDIDHFKSVNDTYGHPVGDLVLQWMAQLLRNHIRSVDRLARYGGEELAIILPETSAKNALHLAETLRRLVASQPFTFQQTEEQVAQIPITISLGVAGIPDNAYSEETLITAADVALYKAKRQGRNRAVQFQDMPAAQPIACPPPKNRRLEVSS
ncbi:MAG TPA: diguanylate cyclase, partial [Chloroflexia bacterium]|nr:diguanylate cyclase [Chloroflexia bacterium]